MVGTYCKQTNKQTNKQRKEIENFDFHHSLGGPGPTLSISDQSEEVTRRSSVRKEFLEISQNSQENNCARVSFLIKLNFCEHLFLQKPLVAASDQRSHFIPLETPELQSRFDHGNISLLF